MYVKYFGRTWGHQLMKSSTPKRQTGGYFLTFPSINKHLTIMFCQADFLVCLTQLTILCIHQQHFSQISTESASKHCYSYNLMSCHLFILLFCLTSKGEDYGNAKSITLSLPTFILYFKTYTIISF